MKKDAKARAKEKKAKVRAQRQKARADAYFIIYYDMGPERSLIMLCEYVAKLGLRKALNTLKRYSLKYSWQQRLIEEDTKRYERDQDDKDKVRSKMVERHSKIGQTLQTLAMEGIRPFQEILKEGKFLKFSPAEIVNLAKVGTDLELRAAGEPTLRIEITTILYNVLIVKIAHIFQEVNRLPTEEARESRFAILMDQIGDRILLEANTVMEEK